MASEGMYDLSISSSAPFLILALGVNQASPNEDPKVENKWQARLRREEEMMKDRAYIRVS